MEHDRAAIAQTLQKEFGLSTNESSMNFIEGYWDIMLSFIAGDQKYFSKIYVHEQEDVVQALTSIMGFLHEQGYPVSPVMRTRSGSLTFHFNDGGGHKPGFVQRFIDAPLIGDSSITKQGAYNVGRAMGRLHAISDTHKEKMHFPFTPSPAWNPEYFHLVLDHFKDVKHRLRDDVVGILETMGRQQPQIKKQLTACRKGFIHNDFNRANVMSRGDEVEAVIDFSDSAHSWYVADVGTALMYLFAGTKQSWPRMKDFMEGYESEFSLRPEEKALISYFIKQRAAISLVENIIDNDIVPRECTRILRQFSKAENQQTFDRLLRL